MSTDQPMPSPEEIQHKLNEFMKMEFGASVVFGVPIRNVSVENFGSGEYVG